MAVYVSYSISVTACIYSHYANLLLRCTINILLKFIVLYFNNFILLRPEILYVILARHNELPEDDILNVETCTSMLFVIIVFDIIVQSLVKSKQIRNIYFRIPLEPKVLRCSKKQKQIWNRIKDQHTLLL